MTIWSDIEQQHVFDFALEDSALNAGSDGDDFVWIHPTVRFFSKEFFHNLNYFGHAGHTADQDDFLNILGRDTRIGQGLAAGFNRALNEIIDQLLQLGPCELGHHMLGAAGIGGDERQIDLRFLRRRQLDFGPFRRFLQTLERHPGLSANRCPGLS